MVKPFFAEGSTISIRESSWVLARRDEAESTLP
jgi:hypothetical protein